MNIYQEELLDHYENPSNYGTLPDPDISHEEDNPLCGDRIRIDLLIEDNTITEVRFCGHGCTISLAAASMLTEKIEGKSLDEVKQLSKDDILDMIGIPLGPYSCQMCVVGSEGPQSGVLMASQVGPAKKTNSRCAICFPIV